METCMWYMQNFDQSDWMFIRCDGELGPGDIPWDGLADWSQELLLQIQAVGGAGGGAWAGSPVVWEPCHNGKFEWLDSNRNMKSNVSLLDDGHLVVLYYPLFLNVPEGIFFCWFRPFSKFLQKIHFCASKKTFTWRVLPHKTDYYLKTWLIVICSCSKNYAVNCTEFIPVFLGMVDSPVAQWGLCLLDWIPLCGLLLPRVWHLDTVRELWPRQSSGDGCFTQ